MSIQDLWRGRDGQPTRRAGTGKRWRVVVDGHPTKAFVVKADAVEWERRLLAQAPTRLRPEAPLDGLIDEYLAGKQHLTPDSVNALKAGAAHVRARFGDAMASDIDHQDVQVWASTLLAEHGPRGADGIRELRPAAAATKAKAVQVLRCSLDIAIKRGLLDTNPARGIDVGKPAKGDPQYLTVKKLRRLAQHAGEYMAMVWLLGTCGPRIGEAVAANVGDVDRKRRRLRIPKSKNGEARDVPILPEVLALLDLDRDPAEPLFVSPRGKRLNADNWRSRVFAKAVEAAGLPPMDVHDLRHTAASLMIASGASVKDVQYALGHKSAKVTLDLYGHRFAAHLAGLAKRMTKMVGKL